MQGEFMDVNASDTMRENRDIGGYAGLTTIQYSFRYPPDT
jgi:hypothetical protein